MDTKAFIARSNFRKWKWKFKRKHVFILPWSLDESLQPLTIESNSGNVLVSLKGNRLTINRHYHFDGATYAPDFENVLLAAACHDALLQLKDKYPFLIDADMANRAFDHAMKEQRFKLRWIYSIAVKLYWKFK